MFIKKQCVILQRILRQWKILICKNMIVVPVKEGENIEKALKKFKRKFEKTGIIKELRNRQAFEKPSVANRKKMMRAVYIQKLKQTEE